MNKRIASTLIVFLLTVSTGLADLTDGLVAYYPFEGDASDVSGNNNHAVVYGAQLTEDRFGNANHAYLFDGFNDTIEAPHSASLDITGPITLSCWVKAQNIYWRTGLIIKAPDPMPDVGYKLRTYWDKAHMGLVYYPPKTGGGAGSDTLVNDNVWHLVTGTYDGSEIRMYVDGQLEGLTLYTAGHTSNTAALQIGHYYYPYNDGYGGRMDVTLNGAIDEVRIYNRALDQSEVTELYTGESGEPIEVIVDITPGGCPNPLNVKGKGLLPVAVLGFVDFDVFAIDPASIRLAGVAPVRSSYEDVSAPAPDSQDECECTAEGPDGYLDLILKFKTQEIVDALSEVTDGESVLLILTGVLSDGDETPIEGADCIRVVKKD
ncbi:MAG: LamG domain-containing protein [Planctomycetota bacterium]|nr:LamG domain-containing protein [Planctomycetota bacterium]